MKTRIAAHDLMDLPIENAYPECFHDGRSGIIERTLLGNQHFGKGFYKELYFKNLHIGYGEMNLANNTVIDFQSDFETVEMRFILSGNTKTTANGSQKMVEFNGNQHNLIYATGFKGCSEWQSGTSLQVFEVNMLPAFFNHYLPDEVLIFRKFAQDINSQRTSLLCKDHLKISPNMRLIINEIITCKRTGVYKKMLIEAKVIELLLLQLEQITGIFQKAGSSIRKSDIDKMYAAKEIILSSLNNPCSLIDLAHQVGTNEFTLKKRFKEVFGTTVFGYLNDVKMEQAKRLLMEQDVAVNQVSDLMGYANPSHFTAAFKRKFGIVPGSLKR